MSRPATIPALHARHRLEEVRLIRAALERCEWRLLTAARELGVTEQLLRRRVEAYPALAADYAERNGGRGRPRTATASRPED